MTDRTLAALPQMPPLDGAATVSLTQAAEAILFAAGTPLSVAKLARLLDIPPGAIESVLDRLTDELQGRGVRLMRHGDDVQLGTAPELASFVARLWDGTARARLSAAAAETLAIVAYRQPVTRAQIEAIRGVSVDRAIATLVGRELIQEVGRLETVGRPVQYGTGFAFLEQLGLTSIDQLPRLKTSSPDDASANGESAADHRG